MRITKTVRLEDQDVEIDIDGNDAVQAIFGETEGWTPEQLLMRVLNNSAAFFKKIPDEQIGKISDSSRTLIANFFDEQEKRFRP